MSADQLNQVRRTLGLVLAWVGLFLAAVTLLKFFGVHVPIKGGVQETALVAIACCIAR